MRPAGSENQELRPRHHSSFATPTARVQLHWPREDWRPTERAQHDSGGSLIDSACCGSVVATLPLSADPSGDLCSDKTAQHASTANLLESKRRRIAPHGILGAPIRPTQRAPARVRAELASRSQRDAARTRRDFGQTRRRVSATTFMYIKSHLNLKIEKSSQ